MELWLVVTVNGKAKTGPVHFDIIGIFDSEEKARAECKKTNYCMGPLVLNRAMHKSGFWVGARYPVVMTPEESERWPEIN